MNEHLVVIAIKQPTQVMEATICYEPNVPFVKERMMRDHPNCDVHVVFPTLHWSSTVVHPQVDADLDTKGG